MYDIKTFMYYKTKNKKRSFTHKYKDFYTTIFDTPNEGFATIPD